MINYSVKSGVTSADLIKINESELAQRLKTDIGYSNEEIEKCKAELLKTVTYKYAYIKVPVDLSDKDYVNLNFAVVKSKNLYKNLQGCSQAFVFAVTLGIGVDRLLGRLNMISQAKHFITDALSSAAVESYCDYVNLLIGKSIQGGAQMKPRFSPGYGDLPLEIQPDVLKALSADKTLGITLNSSFLMTPVKSITAIVGVQDN